LGASRTAALRYAQGSSPRHWARLSHLNLPYRVEWDATSSFTARLTAESIPSSYVRLDMQLTMEHS